MDIKCGIYKITNKLNNKVYIGCSKNIQHRWIAHKSESVLENNPQYNYSIHKAFRKYGIDNFSFEIIESTEEKDLFDKEKYWIKFYDSYNNGYNETLGGDSGPSMPEEQNPNAKLTSNDVFDIRTKILQGAMLSEVYPIYADKITLRGFEHIWRGDNWINILPEAIDYVKSKEYLSKARSHARMSRMSQEQIKIRQEIKENKKKGLKRLDVYEKYKDKYSLSGFNKIWYQK